MNLVIIIPLIIEGLRFFSSLNDDTSGDGPTVIMDDRDIFSYGSSHRDLIRPSGRSLAAGLLVTYGEQYLRQLNMSGPVRGVLANEDLITGLALRAAAGLFGPQKSYTAEDALDIYVRNLAQAVYDYDPMLIANAKVVSFDRNAVDVLDPVFDALGSKSSEVGLSPAALAALGIDPVVWDGLTSPSILNHKGLKKWADAVSAIRSTGSVSQTSRFSFLVLSMLEDIAAETPRYVIGDGFHLLLPSLALLPGSHASVHSTMALIIPPPSASGLLTRSTDRRNAERWGYVPLDGSRSDYEHISRVEIDSVDPKQGTIYRERTTAKQDQTGSDVSATIAKRLVEVAFSLITKKIKA